MNNKIFILVFTLFLISFVSAQNYNNPNLPRIQPPEVLVSPVNNNSINVNNSNCWQGNCLGFNASFNQFLPLENKTRVHCSNVTGNSLCTTQSPTFAGGTFLGELISDVPGGFGIWHRYTVLGGIFPVGRVTSENGVFQIMPENGFDLWMGNFSTSTFRAGNTDGISGIFSARTFVVEILGGARTFESNATETRIYGNSSFGGVINNFTNNVFIGQNTSIKGLRHDWAVANGIINATGVNITSNHQTYNITSFTSLDTTYNNTLDRVVYIDVSFTSTVPSGATAFVTAYVNGTMRAYEGQTWREILIDIGQGTDYHHFGFYVQPTQRWSLNSSTDSGGSVTLERVILTVI